jgi:hypothetical protein
MTTDVDPATRQQLFDLVLRYATGIDQRDWALFRTCWTDDAVSDYGDVGRWHSGEAITEFMTKTHEPCGHTDDGWRISRRDFTPTVTVQIASCPPER